MIAQPKPQPLRPDWYDKPPSEWPSSARTFFSLMATAAERRLAAEAKHQSKGADS